jgi:hypothetical protein
MVVTAMSRLRFGNAMATRMRAKVVSDTSVMQVRSAADLPSTGKVRLLTLDALDGRTASARRARDLIEAIESDLGGGDRLSEGTRQLVQRAAVLGAFIESCEAQWLGGNAVELSDYLAAINVQRRVLATIGLERRARDVTVPTVEDYLAHRAKEKAMGAKEPSSEDSG